MSAISPLQRVVGRTAASSCSRQTAPLVAASRASSRLSPQSSQVQQPLGVISSQEEQRRSFWMDVVTRKRDAGGRFSKKQQASKDGAQKAKFVHEDPEQVVRRHTDETRSDGEPLLDLMFYNDRHEKAWRKRQRLKAQKRYDFDKKHVNDLAKYIAFVKDHKE